MRSLALLLHFYQPPTQSQLVTEQILRSCYLPLADLLLAYPEAKMTLNISGSLLEDITAISDHAFFEKMKILLGRGQVELTNSSVYHSLLPLVDISEIAPQLEINRKMTRDAFQNEATQIIFPPELAIKPELLVAFGNSTVLIDESSVDPNFNFDKIPANQVYKLNELTLVTSARAITEILRTYPQELTAKKFLSLLDQTTGPDQTIFAASDAEVFGHHYTERINLLRELFESKKIKFVKITDAVSGAKTAPLQLNQINPSSWQTTKQNLKDQNPFPVWLDPENNMQVLYNDLCSLTYRLLKRSPDLNTQAQLHYLRGTSSCHYYWLSNWPWWHPELVENGAKELIKCVRSLFIDKEEKIPAEKLYHDFLLKVWNYHWSGEVEKKYKLFDKTRENLLKNLPELN